MINKIRGKLTATVDYRKLLTKIELKSSAFALKSVINLLSWNKGGIHGTFLSFRHLFKIDRCFCTGRWVHQFLRYISQILDIQTF